VLPLGVPVLEAADLETAFAQQGDGLEGQDAVGAAAIGYDLSAPRDFTQPGIGGPPWLTLARKRGKLLQKKGQSRPRDIFVREKPAVSFILAPRSNQSAERITSPSSRQNRR
jgi:hypothetical protein